MPSMIYYLIKFSISLTGVYLFYWIFLRRLTFYTWNRWYLLAYSGISFFIPLVNIGPLVGNEEFKEVKLMHFIPTIGDYTQKLAHASQVQEATSVVEGWSILTVILLAGSLLMIGRFTIQLFSVWRMKKRSMALPFDGKEVYRVHQSIIPFSFGNAIFLNPDLHTQRELEEIIIHEYVHVKQNHSMDILLAELLCIVNWYNPFAWLIRYAIRQNLEFIADDQLLRQGLDKKGYQYHLLRVVGAPLYRIANSFNLSSLKKRIAMMNTMKSARQQLLRFAFLLPLVAVLLLAFRDKYAAIFSHSDKGTFFTDAGIVMDGNSLEPLGGATVRDSISGLTTLTDDRGFFKLKIPLDSANPKVFIRAEKEGYEHLLSNGIGYWPVRSGNTTASVQIFSLISSNSVHPSFFVPVWMGMGTKNKNPDPGYAEAFQMYHSFKIEMIGVDWMMNFKKRPGILDLYTSEDHQQHIVFLKDGTVERYGYTEGPSVDDMAKKYGPLPEFILQRDPAAGSYYLKQWVEISEKASKTFHSKNPLVRQIIFPGDSRVIVLRKDGTKPEIYDMDSGAPNERKKFENEYGHLPDFVPLPAKPSKTAGGFDGQIRVDMKNVRMNMDTVPSRHASPDSQIRSGLLYEIKGISLHRDDAMDQEHRDFFKRNSNVWLLHWKFPGQELEIYLQNNTIEKYRLNSKEDSQLVQSKYGQFPSSELGSYGRQSKISMYNHDGPMTLTDSIFHALPSKVLILVDGKEISRDELLTLDVNQIESVNVIKNEAILKQYGQKAKDGLIEIKTKTKIDPAPRNSSSLKPKLFNLDRLLLSDQKLIFPGTSNLLFHQDVLQLHRTAFHGDTGKRYQYIDDAGGEDGILEWKIVKDYPGEPLYLIDGKRIGNGRHPIAVSQDEIYTTEIVARGDLLRAYGPQAKGGLINIVTKTNKDKYDAHIFHSEIADNPAKMKQLSSESAIRNILYIGVLNPIHVSVEGISDDDLVLTMDSKYGTIKKRKDTYYATVNTAGNVSIRVFSRQKDGSLRFLNSRYFRINYLPAETPSGSL